MTGSVADYITDLEQENKELKTCIEMIKNTEGQAHIEGVRLAKENKELKDINNRLQAIIDDGCAENKRFREENKELKEEKLYHGIDKQFIEDANDRLYFEAEKYRKALEEIREIAKDIIENDVYENSDVKAEKILTKINEVLSC